MVFAVFSSNHQMKKIVFFLVLLCSIMSSCFFADSIFEEEEIQEETLQVKCQNAVAKYLSQKVDQNYEPYGFGTITIHKPKAIEELEKLEKQKIEQGFSTPELDTAIAQKKRYIYQYQIERTIDLDHFFTLTDSLDNTTVFETNFVLNDSLATKDLTAKIIAKLPSDYVSILSFFFYEKPIFLNATYQESKEMSYNFYAFFKEELENKTNLKDKSDFLMHALKMTREVKIKGTFDQQYIMERQVKNLMSKERTDILDYKSLDFSDLYETTDDSTKANLGYYFFHKFTGNYNELSDTNVVLVEFNPFYEIGNIYQMERPFGQYFDN